MAYAAIMLSEPQSGYHAVTVVQLSFDFYMLEAEQKNPISGKAYDSDKLNKGLRNQGIEMIAPHKHNCVSAKAKAEAMPASPG